MSENIKSEFIYQNHLSTKNKLGRMLWGICWMIFVRPFSSNIFWAWRRMWLQIFGAQIPKTALVHASVRVWAPWNLCMKDFACLADRVICYNVGKVVMGSHATVSQDAYLCTASHNIYKKTHDLTTAPIVLEDYAWVGATSFIGMGVTLHEGSVVGAASAVFKDIEPWTVVGGNPAKFIKARTFEE